MWTVQKHNGVWDVFALCSCFLCSLLFSNSYRAQSCCELDSLLCLLGHSQQFQEKGKSKANCYFPIVTAKVDKYIAESVYAQIFSINLSNIFETRLVEHTANLNFCLSKNWIWSNNPVQKDVLKFRTPEDRIYKLTVTDLTFLNCILFPSLNLGEWSYKSISSTPLIFLDIL